MAFILMTATGLGQIPGDWTVNAADFEYTMTITAVIELNGVAAEDSGFVIAAFSEDDCRGVSEAVAFMDGWLHFIMVYGNLFDQDLSFQLYDFELDTVINISNSVLFESGLALGEPDAPYLMTAVNDLTLLVARDDDVVTPEDEVISISVMGNDQYSTDLIISLNILAEPHHGSTQLVADNRVEYTPSPDFHGSDSLLYQLDNGYAISQAMVRIQVQAVNDAPVVADISAQEISEDGELVIVLSADDIDGDTLTFSAVSAETNVTILVSNDSLYMTPAADWNGSSVITVTVDDGSGSENSTDTGTFTLTVTPVNDAPILADISSQSTPEETAIDVALSAADIDEDALTYSAVSDTAAVLVSVTGSTLTLTLQTDFTGAAQITVTVSDGSLEDVGSFVLTVVPVNDSPEAFDLIYPDDELVISDADSVDVTFTWESALDIDGDALSYGLNIYADSEFDTLFIVAASQHRLNIEDFPRDVWLNWDVWVTDGQDTIWSTSTFSLMIDQSVAINAQALIPDEYVLDQNYPNPFNPSTTIRYGLPEETNVSLVIYDIRGQVVQTIASEHQSAGWYDIIWNGHTADGRTISTGIYFARLVAGDYSQVIKMLYLK